MFDKAKPNQFPREWNRESLFALQEAVKKQNPDALSIAISFLEADVTTIGSGYAKERIWKYVVKYNLDERAIRRLCHIALRYLDKPIQREFWYMCRAITRIADNEFWQHVKAKTLALDPLIGVRATYLYEYSKGINAGEHIHQEVSAKWLKLRLLRQSKTFAASRHVDSKTGNATAR
jgi:hypothetical protein